jgi:hypothetical protein
MAEGALAGAQALLSEEDVHKALLAFSAHDPERQGIRVCDLGACFRAMGEDVAESELFDVSAFRPLCFSYATLPSPPPPFLPPHRADDVQRRGVRRHQHAEF